MLSRYRFVLRPRWWGLHVLTVAMVVTMVLLGRWQLTVSEAKHFNLRNFGYALQWWAFSLFTLIMWVRIMRDQARHGELPKGVPAATAPPTAAPEVAYRRYVPPAAPAVDDDVIADYNDYLARLHGKRSAT